VMVSSGGSKTFTIKPDKGCHIVDVLVDGASQGKITKYPFTNVTAKHYIHALFASNLIINAGAGPGGSINPPGLVAVNYNANAIFTITPNAGYHIANVLIDGVGIGPTGSYTFKKVNAAHSIMATFSTVYPVLATASDGGSISPSGVTMIEEGADQLFTMTPQSEESKIVNIRVDEEWIGLVDEHLTWEGNVATYNLTAVGSPHDIMVVFATQKYPVFSKAGKHGTISPIGTTMVVKGASLTYTVTPDSGYAASITVDGESATLAGNTYTFTDIVAPHYIAVTFTKGSASASTEEE
jgi:hypothetical protein